MSDLAAECSQDTAPKPRRRRYTPRRQRIDRRTKIARRIGQLVVDFCARLDVSPSSNPTTYTAVTDLAELVTLSERERAKAIAGQNVDMLALIRLENSCRRSMRDLGLTGPPPPPPLPSLAELLGDADGE
jgi:hypothetical protein